MSIPYVFDSTLDLKLERVIDVPVELVWKVWTEPEHVKVWFCPKPWGVSDCEIDLRPGGLFRTTMLLPRARNFPTWAATSTSSPWSASSSPTPSCPATAPPRNPS